MADAGGGHFYFIGDVAQMRDHITSEVGETLEVVAREVVLELSLPESVRIDSLSPFRVERRGGRVLVFLGDMLSGQVLSVVLRVTFDFGEVGREVGVGVRVERPRRRLRAGGAGRRAGHDRVDLRRSPGERRPAPRPRRRSRRRPPVRRAGEAGGGRRSTAGASTTTPSQALEGVRRRVAAYAGSDAGAAGDRGRAREEQAPAYAAAMPEMARKQRTSRRARSSRMRTPDGKRSGRAERHPAIATGERPSTLDARRRPRQDARVIDCCAEPPASGDQAASSARGSPVNER